MLKVLIVDDEEWIRLGLRVQIDWESLGLEIIGEAANGSEAVEIIEACHPDLVITDIRMPKVDGIALMEYIHNKYPEVVIIVISGYSEFEYAKKAITFCAFDYILKPIEEDVLESTLKKAIAKINEEEEERNRLVHLKVDLNKSTLVVKEKVLTHLVLGLSASMGDEDIEEAMAKLGLNFQWRRMVVLAFRAANFEEVASLKYGNDFDLASFALANVVSELAGDSAGAVLFRNSMRQDEAVLILGLNSEEESAVLENIVSMGHQIVEKVGELIEYDLYIGIGRVCTQMKEVYKSYSQAVEALQVAGILHGSRILHFDEVSGRNNPLVCAEDKEKVLLHYIENGYKAQADHLVEELFHQIDANRGVNPQSIRSTLLELTVGMNRLLKRYGGTVEEITLDRNLTEKIMNEFFTSRELQDWFKAAVAKVTDWIAGYKQTGPKRIINEIVEYVNGHYNEDINLNSMGEMFFMNPAYLSRIFKSETGQNFNDYVSRIRMNSAVELLKDGTLKMDDISEMIGYENVNYFFKKFKEYYHCTPSQFRKKNR